MRTGIFNPLHNRYSYSSTRQTVLIPLDATDATLSFWLYPASSEPAYLSLPTNVLGLREEDAANFGDAQVVLILDQFGNELEQLVNMRRNDQDWLLYSFDVSHYADETIQIYFGTINNGRYGITGMYVDDVTLRSCAIQP